MDLCGDPDTVSKTSPLPQGLSILVSSCLQPLGIVALYDSFCENERNYLFKSYTALE